MKKRLILSFILSTILYNFIYSQKFNLGLMIGGANYQGDLVESTIAFEETNLALGGLVRYNLTPKFDIKLNVYAAKLSGSDANFPSRQSRGFSFNTNILEGGINLEWNILGKNRFSERGRFQKNRTPFIYSGIGAVMFTPKTSGLSENAPELKKNIKDFQFMIPFGVGYKFDFNENWTFTAEFASHVPFTDYLDGVSESGKPNNRDWYVFSGVGVTYLFGAKSMKRNYEGQKLLQ